MEDVTPEKWKNIVGHVVRQADLYRSLDDELSPDNNDVMEGESGPQQEDEPGDQEREEENPAVASPLQRPKGRVCYKCGKYVKVKYLHINYVTLRKTTLLSFLMRSKD